MAEALLLSALLPTVMKKAGSLAVGGLVKMWADRKVENKLEELQRKMLLLQGVVQEAEAEADLKLSKNEALKRWLTTLTDVAYEADDILDDFNYQVMRQKAEIQEGMKGKVRHFFSCYNPLLFRNTMSQKMNDVVEKINHIIAETSLFQLQGNTNVVRQQPENVYTLQTHSFQDEKRILGREKEKEEIMELLIGDDDSKKGVSVLPIYGIGGVGKTTMGRLIYNDERVVKHFQRRMWVCVSDDFSVLRIVKEILKSANIECESSNMEELQCKLRDVLHAKRFLLILDDVWNECPLLWEQLEVLLTSGSAQGSAVVLTTRSEKVSRIVGTVNPYLLHPLPKDDCWILFEKIAFVRASRAAKVNLCSIGKAIVQKCGGLPLAVKALASLMAGKTEEWEWKSVLDSKIWELEDDVVLPSLRLSYHHLPSYMKLCFSYCAIFPKDFELDRDMLIQLWMANGFISSDSTVELELIGHKIFDELVLRCFFQDVQEWEMSGCWRTTCTMHDLIHDLAQSTIGSGCHVLDKPTDISNKKIHHLSVALDARIDKFALLQNYKDFRTLLFLKGCHRLVREFSPTHLRAFKIGILTLKSLPFSVCQLRHLRYLDLSFRSLTTLPEGICDLIYLQTLNLNNCRRLSKLPRGMGKMSSLRHLYLCNCEKLRYMPQGIGRLRCLRTLTAYHIGDERKSAGLGELKDLNNIGGTLHLYGLNNVRSVADVEDANIGSKGNVENLQLYWRQMYNFQEKVPSGPEVLGALKLPSKIRRLLVYGYTGNQFGTWLEGRDMKVFRNLIKVVLRSCSGCDHLPQLGQLPSLEELEIWWMHSLKHMGGSEFYGSAEDQQSIVFPSLKTLVLSCNLNLEKWSGAEGKASFPRLVEVRISNCLKLTTIPSLPSVQSLATRCCPLLHPSKGFFGNMTSLTSLRLAHSDQLVLLLEQEQDDQAGMSLQDLSIDGYYKDRLMLLPSLGRWRNLSSLQKLEILQFENLSSLEGLGRLTSLVDLRIFGIMELTSLPQGMECLKALQCLRIHSCKKLMSLPEGLQQRLPFLRSLVISGCPSLEAPCSTGGEYWSLISDIPELQIGFRRQMGACKPV